MPKAEHAKLGLSFDLPDDLRQRDIEAFFKALREIGGREAISSPERNGNVLRSAARCGWLKGVGEDDIGDWKPPAVTWLAGEIDTLVTEAFIVPGE